MAKIIPFRKKDTSTATLQEKENQNEIVHWITEMGSLLKCIEQSLQNTPNYVTKDINSRR